MMKNPAEEKRYLAIDIAPSLGQAILGRLHDGKFECEEIHRFVPSFLKEGKGLPSWDIDGIIFEIIKALKKAKEAGKTPDYLGIDAWGSDYVLMDEKDERIGPCFYGLEEKDPAIDAVYEILPFAELYESNGLQFQANTSIYQLMRDLKEGRLKKAKTFMMLPDYLNFLLTGKKKQEYCNGATTGLINSSTRDWDEELIEKLGYPKTIFLPLEEPGSVIGPLKKEIEEEIGFGVTLLLPATDRNASMVLGLPLEKNEPYLICDQWPLLGEEEGRAHTNKKSRRLNYSNEGAPDKRFRYQKAVPGLAMVHEAMKELGDRYNFFELLAMAAQAHTKELIDFSDIRFTTPKSMIQAVEESVGRTLGPGELVDILLRSLAAHCADALDEFEAIVGKDFHCLYIIGNGARSAYFVKLLAQAVHRPVYVGGNENAALGNILMQMLSSGEVNSIAEGRAILKESFPAAIVEE